MIEKITTKGCKMKKKDALKEYLKKFDWLWENNTPLTTKKQKSR